MNCVILLTARCWLFQLFNFLFLRLDNYFQLSTYYFSGDVSLPKLAEGGFNFRLLPLTNWVSYKVRIKYKNEVKQEKIIKCVALAVINTPLPLLFTFFGGVVALFHLLILLKAQYLNLDICSTHFIGRNIWLYNVKQIVYK